MGIAMKTRLAPAPLLFVALTTGCVVEGGGTPVDTDAQTSDADSSSGDTTDADTTDDPTADTSDGEPTGSACAAPAGPGTDVATTLDADATWTAEGSPYRIAGTTTITATITLEPCTVVQLGPDVRLYVGNEPAPGSLVAQGEVTLDEDGNELRRPVRFERLDEATAWGSVEVETTGLLDGVHTDFVGGGSINAGAALIAWGLTPDGATTANIHVDDVVIEDAQTHGIYLKSRAAFTDDSGLLRVTGTADGGFPIVVQAGAVHSLPMLEVTDNATDVVRIETFANIDDDTFPSRGVPLQLDDALYIGTATSDGTSTLTIEAGVELQFAIDGAGSGITVGFDATHEGLIVAEGTADAPITMRSAETTPAAGDWMGLYFRNSPAQGNVLANVTIAHAGAISGAQGYGCGPAENHASILLLTEQAMEPFLDGVTITDAGGDTQLILGWLDDAPEATAQSFADGNTFAASPVCTVSLPRDTNNACPGDAEPDCL